MPSVEEVLEMLAANANPDQLAGMAKYGMTVENRLGVKVPQMRKIAKEIGVDHKLALELWETGITEAMILASMVDIPDEVTEEQMEAWVQDFRLLGRLRPGLHEPLRQDSHGVEEDPCLV